jgi:transcriptional regulator with XRE-family HTH domain
MNAHDLVERAMAKTGCSSTRQLGERLGVSHVAVGKWMRGESCPTFEQAAELAEAAGLPAIKTAAEVRLSSPDGARHRAFLRRIAAAAAIVLVVGTTVAAENGGPSRIRTYNQGIMSPLL